MEYLCQPLPCCTLVHRGLALTMSATTTPSSPTYTLNLKANAISTCRGAWIQLNWKSYSSENISTFQKYSATLCTSKHAGTVGAYIVWLYTSSSIQITIPTQVNDSAEGPLIALLLFLFLYVSALCKPEGYHLYLSDKAGVQLPQLTVGTLQNDCEVITFILY